MERLNNVDELILAWQALNVPDASEGWRTIPITTPLVCKLRAGRRFPENEEAVLFSFPSSCIPRNFHLPQGGGFRVIRVELEGDLSDTAWIAVSRLQSGSFDLFQNMVSDLYEFLYKLLIKDQNQIFKLLLARIIAWQDFMERGRLSVLSKEAEIGLFGELLVISNLLIGGVSVHEAVESWKGPIMGTWDFQTLNGAFEVKSTTLLDKFPANIGSLEQLDDSCISNLFLIGIRLENNNSGVSLPELIQMLTEYMTNNPITYSIFVQKLLKAGYSDLHADKYQNRFIKITELVYKVDETFPRLTHQIVPVHISEVKYTLDLDTLNNRSLHLEVINQLYKGM